MTGQRGNFLENFAPVKQTIVTLDLEGVLTPEIWIAPHHPGRTRLR
jgi:hypothetical protein